MGVSAAKTMALDELLYWLKVIPETGEVIWNYRPDGSRNWNSRYAGNKAGGLNSQGYHVVNLQKVHHRVHHIVWKVVHGYWPSEIDHIDGNRTNNRISNLREVSRAENLKNRGIGPRNSSGVLGVSRSRNRWRARIGIRGNSFTIGYFGTKEEAIAARRAAEKQFGFHPNHGRREATCGR